jgi:hypothetical protein
MPWDSVDKWRDEDGWPPPHLERTLDWWKETHSAGRSSEAVDAVLKENGVHAAKPAPTLPPLSDPPPWRRRRCGSDLGPFAYLRDTRAARLRDRELVAH